MLRSRFSSKIAVSMLSAVCLLASQAVLSPIASAAALRGNAPVRGVISSKPIRLTLSNETGETLQLQVGDSPMTVEAGKTVELNVPAGTRIVNVTATKNHAAGEVLTEVSKDFAGAKLRIG